MDADRRTKSSQDAAMTSPGPTTALRTRDQIAVRHQWDLADVFKSQADFEKSFSEVESLMGRLRSMQGSLSRGAETLLAALRQRDDVMAKLERVILFAGLEYHQDMSIGEAQGRWDRAHSLGTKAAEAVSWMTPEILAIPEHSLRDWMHADRELAVYRHAIDDILRQKAHTLSPREEELLAMAGEMAAGPENIFSRFTNTNLDFPTIKDADGSDLKLSQAKYGALIYSPDRRVRRDAFLGLHETYMAKANTLSATLSAQVKQHIFFARARRYETCLEGALDGPHIPVAVYDNLITTVGRHLDKLHRYVDLRRRLLNLDDVHGYDLYVPMIDAAEETVEYDDAMETVIRSLSPLGADYTDVLRTAAASRWIDVYETPNKRSGAYSWGSYLTHPYLLLNYNGTVHDRSTLAHELGHAMHSWYTVKNQPIVYGDYATFCAEVASTVNEVLLADYLLQNATDDTQRLLILQQQIESIRTTVYRQTMFAEYERMIHARAEENEPLTGDWLCASYAEIVRKYYGPKLVIDDCAKAEGLRIPHFYRNFYVYTYATSHCAAVNIGRRILAGDRAAVDGHKRFLSAGSSMYPLEILKLAGVDMHTPAAIDDTMRLFGELMDQIESLALKHRRF